MKHCFNLVVKVCLSRSSGGPFQCQGMMYVLVLKFEGSQGFFGWLMCQIANLIGTTMLRSLAKATQCTCLYKISSVWLIGLFGKCNGRLQFCLSFSARHCNDSDWVTEKLKQSMDLCISVSSRWKDRPKVFIKQTKNGLE